MASGQTSHSEGYKTVAEGHHSHAEGTCTETKNGEEHAEDKFNLSHVGNTIHSIGIGASESDRKNAVEVLYNGKVYVKGVGNYDGKDITGANVKDLAAILGTTGFIQCMIDAVNAMNATQKA